jgi:Disulphide bond corrector protein DsbC/AhpC/TSA family
VELQGIYDDLSRAGHALYAVSYDAVDVLTPFSEKHGITYPLLSDEGSRVIRELGLLNEDAPPPVAGIPHPGTFVLNPDGTVRSKHFYPSYRERDTGVGVLAHLLGVDGAGGGAAQEAVSDGVAVTARLEKDSYAWGQRVWLRVQLDIAPGLHVYGRPIPDGYYPLEVSVAPLERVLVGAPHCPAPTAFRIQGIEEQFVVYDGSVRVEVPLTFMTVDAGTLTVAVTVSYQACSATDCLPPTSVDLTLTIDEQALVDRPQPR